MANMYCMGGPLIGNNTSNALSTVPTSGWGTNSTWGAMGGSRRWLALHGPEIAGVSGLIVDKDPETVTLADLTPMSGDGTCQAYIIKASDLSPMITRLGGGGMDNLVFVVIMVIFVLGLMMGLKWTEPRNVYKGDGS